VDPVTDDRIVPVAMPKWGLSMQLGKITAWVVAEGDEVQVGDDLADIETEKITGTLEAADELAGAGIEAEVVDPRTTSPLDEDTILESVEGTGRLVVVDEATPRCNLATDISALVARKAFGALRAPIEMVTAPHTPVPFSGSLEDLYIPDPQRVVNTVKTVTEWKRDG